MKKHKIYLISGLGADERAFKNILWPDNCDLQYLPWIENNADESLANYSRRFIEEYKIEENSIFVALSFGGLIVREISKIIGVKQCILISSFQNENSVPKWMRVIYKLSPKFVLRKMIKITSMSILYYFFSISRKKEKELLKSYIENTSSDFIFWSISSIMDYKFSPQSNIKYIHGTKDRLLKCESSDYLIEDGGHFMIYDKASKVSNFINDIIANACYI